MPAALRYMTQNQAAAASRPWVTVGDLELDPCNMRLIIGTLRATEHFGSQRFSDISHLDLRLSWTLPPRLSPMVKTAQTIRRQDGCVCGSEVVSSCRPL